jgi:hypothetical protein
MAAAVVMGALGLTLGPTILFSLVALGIAIRDVAASTQGPLELGIAAAAVALCVTLSLSTVLSGLLVFRGKRLGRSAGLILMHLWAALLAAFGLVFGLVFLRPAVVSAFGSAGLGGAYALAIVTVSTIGTMAPTGLPVIVIRLLREQSAADGCGR